MQAINHLWERFLPEIRERVVILESAASAVTAGKLTEAQRQEAQSAAHKLAGTLGTFSLSHGTVLAREAESIYSNEQTGNAETGKRLAAIASELHALIESRRAS